LEEFKEGITRDQTRSGSDRLKEYQEEEIPRQLRTEGRTQSHEKINQH